MSDFLHADEQDEKALKRYKMSDFSSLLFIARYALPYLSGLTLAALLIGLGGGLAMISAWAMGPLVDRGLMHGNSRESWVYAGTILLCEILSVMIIWPGRKLLAKKASFALLDLRRDLFAHLQELPLSYFDRQPQGRIVTRLTHDVEGIEDFFTSGFGRFLSLGILMLISTIALIAALPRLGTILVLLNLPVVIFIYTTRHKVREMGRAISKGSGIISALCSEFVSGIEVIRSFGLEKWSQERFDERVDEHLSNQLYANTYYGWSRPLLAFLCGIPTLALILFGGREVLLGTISLGLFVTAIRYLEKIYRPLLLISRELQVLQQAFVSSERVASFLKQKVENDLLGKDGHLGHEQFPLGPLGHIELKNLKMAYQKDLWVLKGISLEVRPGQKVGIVGRTGSGKSTIVSLLLRLYDYQEGEVFLDGHPLREYKRQFLRQEIGLVSQDVVLFKASVWENLTTSDHYPLDVVENCANKTGLTKVLARRGLSLDSLVLENGANLSLGEKQLMAITRILLRSPKILILDEATASIDPELEEIIQQAIGTLMDGRTCLLIAHRLKTLQICDKLFVFRHGELVEEGTAEELIGRRGYFYDLYQAKEKSYTSFPGEENSAP